MKKLISYVFPIYNETDNIDFLYETICHLLLTRKKVYNFEIIFVNDGSKDDSLRKLLAIQKKDKCVSVINFARNFGHQIAVTAGLDYAHGDAVIIMDSDLQDPPEVSLQLINKWEEGYDVVYAQRRTRKDTYFKKQTAAWFYWLLNRVADIDIPPNTGDFRLISRRVVDALAEFREHNRFLRGLISYVGFRQIAVPFDRDERRAGTSSYPIKNMLKLAGDGIFGFSWSPILMISRLGYAISTLSFLGIMYVIALKLFDPSQAVPGWTFTAAAVLFIGGIQLVMLGVLGNYVGRIYAEAQNRPLYIVESTRGPRKSNSSDTSSARR
jgi:glycosyltransferase involved in cell wall biosynthesis